MVATIHKLGLLALFLGAGSLLPGATAPSMTECRGSVNGYEGPCPLGALPAFFDDFAYTSAQTDGRFLEAHEGDLFGRNDWRTRDGVEFVRGWYRYNRDDLPLPGAITFGSSTMTLRLPEGLAAEDFARDPTVHTGFAAEAGTYVWRVRVSELWEGQRVRQAAWTISGGSYVFERHTPSDTTRFTFWSELDFENENHFEGEHREGRFIPDFITRMNVGNHIGRLETRRRYQRLSHEGPVAWDGGRGNLARNRSGRGEVIDAPIVPSWADEWLYLVLNVDAEQRTATYRMIPERPKGALAALTGQTFTADSAFYPQQAMHVAVSLHWIEPTGRLRHPLSLEIDWFYHSPVNGLTLDDARLQVDYLRRLGLPRVNTTGRPTFESYHSANPIGLGFEGPRVMQCGDSATWLVVLERPGRYHTRFRYRVNGPGGSPGTWQELFAPQVALAPPTGSTSIQLEAVAQDQWAPHGIVGGQNGWRYPHPDNHSERAELTVPIRCSDR